MLESLIPLGTGVFLLSTYIVHHYASPGTAIWIRLLAIVSLTLGFGGVVLLPIDLSRTSTDVDEPNETLIPWTVTYWSTFFLAWIVLPYVREILYSGYFSRFARCKMATRTFLNNYMIMGGLLVVFVVAVAIHLKSWHVIPILMALGNTYGLLLVSLLLGYGLVDLPRRMWRKAAPELELRRTQIMAGAADEALFDAVWELQDCEDAIDKAVARCRGTSTTGDKIGGAESSTFLSQPSSHRVESTSHAACIEELVRQRNLTAVLDSELQNRRTKRPPGSSRVEDDGGTDTSTADQDTPTIDTLAQLSYRLKMAQTSLVSAEQRWVEIVETHDMYSKLVEGEIPYPRKEALSLSSATLADKVASKMRCCTQWFYYIWMTKLRGCTFRLFGFTTACLSAVVLWSEATMAIPYNLSPFSYILRIFDEDDLENGLFFKIAALMPLLYMSLCVYTSLFKVSLFGPNCLRGWKQSPGVALVFNAQYLIRMQFPLGYNYLLMLKIDTSSTNCAFSKVMSDMSTVPFLGTSFSFYAPLLIIALCFFTLYNGYPRMLAMLGIQHEDSVLMGNQETLESQVNEGIVLLSRNRRRQENKRQDSHSSNGNSDDANRGENSNWWYNVVV